MTDLNSTMTPLPAINMNMHLGLFVPMVIISAIGTVGNLFIIGAVCVYKNLRTIGHVFIVNLAVADLIITAYIMPTGLATSQADKNPFSTDMCNFNAFLILCTVGVSTQSLMLIAVERYIHICKTKYYRKIFSPKLAALYVVLIWTYSVIWTAQGYTGWASYSYGKNIYVCLLDEKDTLSYNICLVLFGMLLPIAVMIFSYTKIFRTVKQSHVSVFKRTMSNSVSTENLTRNEKKLKGEHRFIMTLFIIVVVFIVCWFPTAVTLSLGKDLHIPDIVHTLTIWLSFTNSSMNSIIYGVMNKNFRKGYTQLLSHLFCCQKLRQCGLNEKCNCLSKDESQTSTSQSKHTPLTTDMSLSQSPAKDNQKRQEMHERNNQTANHVEHGQRHIQQESRHKTTTPNPPIESIPRTSITSRGTVSTISSIISEQSDLEEGGFQSYSRSPQTIPEEVPTHHDIQNSYSNSQNQGYSAIQHVRLKETIL